MHNNIMATDSKDHPPMLGLGRYSQWRSHFLWYIDTKINGEGLTKCILSGPYVPSTVLVQAVAATEENKEHFQSEKEAIFLLLTGIGDEIYSTVDACNTANEMKFTSHDGESMESYYSWFYKLMNELTRNNLQVTTINRHHLISLTFDILKQYQKEVNDIRAERIAKSANRPISTSCACSTIFMSKEIAKPVTPPSELDSDEDNDPEQAQWKKMMMCKQAEQGVPLQAEQADWLEDTDEEIDEQELEAHYSFMENIQEVLPKESSSTD
ncbi:hypothetical protein Tco_0739784 [Tanacetum coccineum]